MPKKMPGNDFHEPITIKKGYKTQLKKAKQYIQEDGLRIEQAVALAFGVHEKTWFNWQRMVREDEEKGFTGTRLMEVYYGLIQANAGGERKVSRKAMELVEEGNPEMVKFILERRFGYKKTSAKEVEVATKDDLNFNINIVDSKKED